MKLFLFCESLSCGKGGVERLVTELSSEMIQRGHDVYLGYNGAADPAYAQHEEAVLIPWDTAASIEQYQKKILEIDPDVFFVFYFNQGLMLYRQFCLDANIPFGMEEGTNPERLCFSNWKNLTGRRAYPLWERELIASSATRIRLMMPGYVDSFPAYIRQNTRSFPNPAPRVQRISEIDIVVHRPKRIISIGGLKRNKNLRMLIKAFIQVSQDFPEWEIHDYGGHLDQSNKYHQSIKSLIDEHGIQGRIVFHGPTDDIYSEYAKAQIHVISSLSEGCPMCVLEAMALGVPSIGVRSCPGTNELIQHYRNGLLVENDIKGDALAKALRELLPSQELRKKLGEQAFYDARNYQHEAIYDKWEELFKEMLDYKQDKGKLLREQIITDKERALHMERSRKNYFNQD